MMPTVAIRVAMRTCARLSIERFIMLPRSQRKAGAEHRTVAVERELIAAEEPVGPIEPQRGGPVQAHLCRDTRAAAEGASLRERIPRLMSGNAAHVDEVVAGRIGRGERFTGKRTDERQQRAAV